MSTEPAIATVLTKNVIVGLLILAAVRPGGRELRSNWISPVFPPPTLTAVAVPKLDAGAVELT